MLRARDNDIQEDIILYIGHMKTMTYIRDKSIKICQFIVCYLLHSMVLSSSSRWSSVPRSRSIVLWSLYKIH